MIPPNWAAVPVLRQAFDLANRVNLEPEELEDLERREIFIADQRNALLKAQRQGYAEGRKEQALDIARALLDALDLDTIAAKTDLSIEELQQLRNEAALSEPGKGN
jgi:predicted transposase/invertase (TIGR01784 family)